MIQIIDKTLATLDGYCLSAQQIQLFCSLLIKTGVTAIEISTSAYEKIGELPENMKYILAVNNIYEIEKYPYFHKYSIRHDHSKNSPNIINEFQINDAREINILKQYANMSMARITGIDDLMCLDYVYIMETIKETFNGTVDLCPQDDYHCATAIAVQWILDGGNSVTCSFSGSGGFAKLEEVLLSLRVTARHKPNLDLSVLQDLKKLYEEITNVKLPLNKPVVGDNIFVVEAGIHADGVSKNPVTYEPYDPKIVGAKRSLVIGKHSGKNAINIVLSKLKLKLTENEINILIERIKDRSMELGNNLTSTEFLEIVSEVKVIEGEKVYS